MTESPLQTLVIIADCPDALTPLGGVSLLERARRIAWQIGFREATILSNSIPSISAHLSETAWRTANVSLKYKDQASAAVTIGEVADCLSAAANERARMLIMFANFYCDPRLVRAVAEANNDSILIDSERPPAIEPLWENSASTLAVGAVSAQWLSGKTRDSLLDNELSADLAARRIAAVDAGRQPAYLPDMRRSVRPVFFPAPSPQHRAIADRILIDATQKGVLDFPALVHAPIEKWIVARICRTRITPNQITLFTGLLGILVTLLYLSGRLWAGALLALAIGILDGLDGKLARLRIQTTEIGKGEHTLDYCVEMSWWAALAWHFHATAEVPSAYIIWAAFFAANVLESRTNGFIKRRLGKSLDDVSAFDRLVRFVGGRRNVYTWLLAACLILGQPPMGFIAICFLGIATSAIRIVRALQIGVSKPPG